VWIFTRFCEPLTPVQCGSSILVQSKPSHAFPSHSLAPLFTYIRNASYRVCQMFLTVFETWIPSYPLGGFYVLTASMHNDLRCNWYQHHSFPWMFSGHNLLSVLADITSLTILPEAVSPGYLLWQHFLSVLTKNRNE